MSYLPPFQDTRHLAAADVSRSMRAHLGAQAMQAARLEPGSFQPQAELICALPTRLSQDPPYTNFELGLPNLGIDQSAPMCQ